MTRRPGRARLGLAGALAVSVCCAAALSGSAVASEADGSFLWRASAGDRSVYLLGSIHYMKQEAYPLAPIIERAFAESEIVVFETDIDKLGEAAVAMLAAGSLPAGRTLSDELEPELYDDLVGRLDELGLDRASIDRMTPWMVALTLTALELQRSGYLGSEGIDAHYAARAADAGKQRRWFESIEYQVSLFTGMSAGDSAQFLRYTLTELDTVIPVVDEIVAAWKRGDTARIERLLTEGFDEHPELYAKLVTERNRRWLPEIEGLLSGDVDAMVVVGSLHLVGEQGLIELLRSEGYEVEQL